jgi:hypothetical protein
MELRGIAAPDVTADQAHPEMHPVVTALQAFLAPIGVWGDVAGQGQMFARCHHDDVLSSGVFDT